MLTLAKLFALRWNICAIAQGIRSVPASESRSRQLNLRQPSFGEVALARRRSYCCAASRPAANA